ncbi:hypothetical protein [Pseudomonas sichuanensis]|uniref:hypothetical protein n=1 Tax=Pseudomonas sichuanensis TaxID=2213015 RepID=UPI002203763D|nr:hypothetical protein LOY51_11625 [Pseudomonas sichuanensis]
MLQTTSRLGVKTFAFGPADNLLREYAGTHYQYDERGNLVHRLLNGDPVPDKSKAKAR